MERYKYPRTPHLPFSPKVSEDDVVGDVQWGTDEVVITEKMDGENATIYHDGTTHARSTTSLYQARHSRIRALAAELGHKLPQGWRICGEDVWARHVIPYENLEAFFLAFAVINSRNFVLGWDEAKDILEEVGIATVPVLYRGLYPGARQTVRLWQEQTRGRQSEGFVIRHTQGFPLTLFQQHVSKWVSASFETDPFWGSRQTVFNKLAPRG